MNAKRPYNRFAVAPKFSIQQYRLKDTTIAIVSERDRDNLIHVPAGSTITVCDSLRESDRPNREIHVKWIGKELRMFAVDILERGERLT
jgi:hypothetical protein